uniref:Cytochrome P450 71A1 n=1 Tax=Cajanus cajan TaxID=3821 RepID=A0A151TR99_CAJCA|nr:Cytochrome P450 71A1 [Cajanus cajan]
MTQVSDFSLGDLFPLLRWVGVMSGQTKKYKATFGALDAFFDHLIAERKMARSDSEKKDFLDALLELQDSDKLEFELTTDDLKALIMDMFLGGSDTTSTTLEWAMTELVKNPSIMNKVQEEVRRVVRNKSKLEANDIDQMDYLKCVVKETLRLHPPAPLLVPRETRSNVKLGGYDIPNKTMVFVNAWAIQRDHEFWEKPEEFIPERFESSEVNFNGQDFQFIPFGSGRRKCPGMAFGLASVEDILANILYWFDWKVPGSGGSDKELDMSEKFGLTVNKRVPLMSLHLPSFMKQMPYDLNATLFMVLSFFISMLLVFKITRRCKLNLPPSPPKLPIIGNYHQLGTLPHRSFRTLSQKYGPLLLLHLGQLPVLVVSSAEFAKEVLHTHDLVFASRPHLTATRILLYGCKDIAFSSYGDIWRQKRKLCVIELLSMKRVQSVQFIREEEVEALVSNIRNICSSNGCSVNLSKMLIAAANNVVCRCMFGRKYDDDDGNCSFGEVGREVMIQIQDLSLGDLFPLLERKMENRDSEKKDFLDTLLQLQDSGKLEFELTTDDLKAILMDMFLGGSDTTSTTIEWAMAELIKNRGIMNKVQEEQFCYRVMPFGLKNARATYQQLMDKVFHQQIGRNMEVYVDNMVGKTTSVKAHVVDLAEVFSQIRRHNMRLNPEKCVFGVQGGKFLGFMITSRGIEANPEKYLSKIEVVLKCMIPKSIREVKSFLRLAYYYRRVIEEISKIALPLTRTPRKSVVLVVLILLNFSKSYVHYLYDSKLEVFSDHKSLKYLLYPIHIRCPLGRLIELYISEVVKLHVIFYYYSFYIRVAQRKRDDKY